ncbi:Nucleoporin NSP1 [Yarrowia sp. C11]|nr:Nucleoporin NSP1 [Yarrowia sp. C11]
MSNSNGEDGGTSQVAPAPTFTFGQKSQFSFGTQNKSSDNNNVTSDTNTNTTDTKPAFGSGTFSFAKPADPKAGDKTDTKPSLFDTPAKPKTSLFDTPKETPKGETGKSLFDKPAPGFNFGSKPVEKTEEKKTEKDDKEDVVKGKENSDSKDKPTAGFFGNPPSSGFGASGFGNSGSGMGSSTGVTAGSFSFAAQQEKQKDDKPTLSFGGFGSKPEKEKGDKPAKEEKDEKPAKQEKDEKPAVSFGSKPEKEDKGDKPALSFGSKPAFSFGSKPEKGEKDDTKPALSFGSKPALSFGSKPSSTASPFTLGAKAEDKTESPKPSGFGFSAKLGGQSDEKTATKPTVSFSSKPEEKAPESKPFSLGSSTSHTPSLFAAKTEPPKSSTAGFGFGSSTANAPTSTGPSFNSSAPKASNEGFSMGSSFGAKPASKPGLGFGSTSNTSGFGASGSSGFGASGSSGFGSTGFGAPKASVPADRAGSAPPGFSSTTSAPQKSNLSKVSTAASVSTPGQRVALKQNLLFTAIGDTLYYNYITGEQTREKVVTVGFPISSILLNPSNTLLAVVGEKNISVIRINDSDIAKSSVQDISKHISASSVRSVLWNPIADPDATLEVLTGDNKVVSLGVSLETNIEKSVFELAEEDDRIDSIGEVVSFSFGHSSEVMGLLTLYLLNEDGDIFCLSPWMPSSALLTQSEIQGIFDQAVYIEQTTKVSSGLPLPGVSTTKMFKANLVWCYDLWRQIPLANKDVRHGQEVALKVSKPKPQYGDGKLKFQGPFSVTPYPEQMYNETAKQLITINSRGLALFAELFESGRINILMLAGGPVVCSWEQPENEWVDEMEEEEDGENELGLRQMVLLETIDLKGESVLSQCLHDGLVHSLAVDSVTQIDTRNWYRKLAGAFVEQDMQVLNQLQNAKLRSSRVQISMSSDFGVSTFTQRLILVSDQVYECDMSISEHGDLSLSASELEKASAIPESAGKVGPADFKRGGLITAVSPEIIHKINSVKIQPTIPQNASFSMSEKLRQHPEMVQVFTQISNHFSRENLKLEEVSILMERRLAMQKSELRRQLVDLESVKARFEKLQKYYGDTDMLDSLKKLIARQEDHEKRFDKLLTDLNRSQSLPLSDAERKWHIELNHLKGKLPEFEKQAKQAQTQAKQLAGFARNSDTSFNSADAIQGITRAELSRTSFMLEEEDRVAEQARQKLELLLHKSQDRLNVLKAQQDR